MLSANQANSTPAGSRFVTPAFLNVGGGKYDFANTVVNGASDDMTVYVQAMDLKTGHYGEKCYWYNEFIDGQTVYPAGWFDKNAEELPTIDFQPSMAVFISRPASGVTFNIKPAL